MYSMDWKQFNQLCFISKHGFISVDLCIISFPAVLWRRIKTFFYEIRSMCPWTALSYCQRICSFKDVPSAGGKEAEFPGSKSAGILQVSKKTSCNRMRRPNRLAPTLMIHVCFVQSVNSSVCLLLSGSTELNKVKVVIIQIKVNETYPQLYVSKFSVKLRLD